MFLFRNLLNRLKRNVPPMSLLSDLLERLKRNDPRLILVDLSDRFLRISDAQDLAGALGTNITVTTLDLSYNYIRDDGAQALANMLKTNTTLTTLSLNLNRIGDRGVQALANMLKTNTTLITLNLYCNRIGYTAVQALIDGLKSNTTLTTLDLSNNDIGNAVARALAKMLATNTTVTTLVLCWNFIGNDGALALAGALETNTTLTTLDLTHNYFGYTVTDIDEAILARINGYLERNKQIKEVTEQAEHFFKLKELTACQAAFESITSGYMKLIEQHPADVGQLGLHTKLNNFYASVFENEFSILRKTGRDAKYYQQLENCLHLWCEWQQNLSQHIGSLEEDEQATIKNKMGLSLHTIAMAFYAGDDVSELLESQYIKSQADAIRRLTTCVMLLDKVRALTKAPKDEIFYQKMLRKLLFTLEGKDCSGFTEVSSEELERHHKYNDAMSLMKTVHDKWFGSEPSSGATEAVVADRLAVPAGLPVGASYATPSGGRDTSVATVSTRHGPSPFGG